MPARKTDWKRERQKMQDGPVPTISGEGESARIIPLTNQHFRKDAAGTPTGSDAQLSMSREDLMALLQKAQLGRRKKRPPLKGLFGGGE